MSELLVELADGATLLCGGIEALQAFIDNAATADDLVEACADALLAEGQEHLEFVRHVQALVAREIGVQRSWLPSRRKRGHHKKRSSWRQIGHDEKMEGVFSVYRPLRRGGPPIARHSASASSRPAPLKHAVVRYAGPAKSNEANVLVSRSRYEELVSASKACADSAAAAPPFVPVSPAPRPVEAQVLSATAPGKAAPKAETDHEQEPLWAPEAEELSIVLSRKAREEASLCVGPDGALERTRLAASLLSGTERFCRLLLSHLPLNIVRELAKDGAAEAMRVPAALLKGLLQGDVVNSALLADVARRRRAWTRRPLPVMDAEPSNLGAELLGGAMALFPPAPSGCALAPLCYRPLDAEEMRHPQVYPFNPMGGRPRVVPSLNVFRVLLSVFSGGLLDDIPFDAGVMVGGSAVTACLTLPESDLLEYGPALNEVAALRCRLTAKLAVSRALGGCGGGRRVTEVIFEFVGRAEEAREKLNELVEKRFHSENKNHPAPYNLADIDLYFVAPTLTAAVTALNRVQRALHVSITSAVERLRNKMRAARLASGGYRNYSEDEGAAYTMVRTPNSVTFCPRFPLRNVQLILHISEHMEEFLCDTDMDCTAAVYDGRNVWAAPQAVRAFETGYNLVSNRHFCQAFDAVERVSKYADRGFGTLVYELCRHEPRCDVVLDSKTNEKLEAAKKRINNTKFTLNGQGLPALDPDEVVCKLLTGGYDKLYLPRGPSVTPEVIAKLVKFGHVDERVVALSENFRWCDELRWRRGRTREMFGEDGGARRSSCYVCGALCPAAAPTQGGASVGSGSVGGGASGGPIGHSASAPPPPNPPAGAASRRRRRGPQQSATMDAVAKAPRPVVSMCNGCCEEGAFHRSREEDMQGYTAVVTGGRCKVGYEACLKLLRCGAFVVTSTRFPRAAAERFLSEPDTAEWNDRLHIYGVDFTHLGLLEAFIAQVARHYPIDILVNNAAQTVRRPPAYYTQLFERERDLYDGLSNAAAAANRFVRELGSDPWEGRGGCGEPVRAARSGESRIEDVSEGAAMVSAAARLHANATNAVPLDVDTSRVVLPALVSTDSTANVLDMAPEALLSAAVPLVPRLPGDDASEAVDADGRELFPKTRSDFHGEPLDLRPASSWTLTMAGGDGVAGRELLEVLAVNAVAPFMLFQGLLGELRRSSAEGGKAQCGRFVVNVTSQEGTFAADGSAAKTSEHPHTNMAKAALNMLTKTAAPELASLNVFCTAVDPGWISMMRPGDPESASRPLPPLSEADGAARVLAPILDGVKALREGRVPAHGVLLKNFRVTPW